MSIALVNQLRPMTGFTFAEKSILYVLADSSHDGESVFLRMEKLSLYAGCSVRQARRILRRLEEKKVLLPQGETGGRGYVHVYKFNLAPGEPGKEIPAPVESPSTSATNNNHPDSEDQQNSHTNPLKFLPGESFRDYIKRRDRLGK